MNFRKINFLFWLFLTAIAVLGGSAEAFAYPSNRQISPVDPPRILYHWTKLDRVDRLFDTDGHLVFRQDPESAGSKLVTFNKVFGLIPRVFAWTNPVNASAYNEREVHGGEVLVAMEIDVAHARAVQVSTIPQSMDNRSLVAPINQARLGEEFTEFAGVDLIYHRLGTVEKPMIQEWIVLNPHIVKKTVVDPRLLGPLVARSIKELRDPHHLFSKEELYSFATRESADGIEMLTWNEPVFRNAIANFLEENYLQQTAKILDIVGDLPRPSHAPRECRDVFR